MAGRIAARLAERGIELPAAPAPVAAYVPYVVSGNTLYVSGQITMWKGEKKYVGKIGGEISPEEGKHAARLCALNLLAQAREACGGDLDRIARVVKLVGFVNSVSDFTAQPAVVNGASELMQEVFGDAGRHARSAVGVASLPFNVAVEVEAIFELA